MQATNVILKFIATTFLKRVREKQSNFNNIFYLT